MIALIDDCIDEKWLDKSATFRLAAASSATAEAADNFSYWLFFIYYFSHVCLNAHFHLISCKVINEVSGGNLPSTQLKNRFAANWQLVWFGSDHPSTWSAADHWWWVWDRVLKTKTTGSRRLAKVSLQANSGQANNGVKLKMQLASWAAQVDINENFSR